MFGFIAKHRGVWPADWLCEALGVSRGGFYAWLTRPRSQRLMTDHGVVCSMSRSGNVWDNAAMESFFSSLFTTPWRVRVPAHHGGGTPPLQCYGSPAFARPSTMR